jgi:tetratricopeptide (TPR) repeat protein
VPGGSGPGFGLASSDEADLMASAEPVRLWSGLGRAGVSEVWQAAAGFVEGAHTAASSYAALERGLGTLREAGRALEASPETALALVDRVLERGSETALSGRALYLRGQALARQGDWRAALESWERIEGTPIDDYVAIRRAEALLELGRASAAADAMSDLLDRLRETPNRVTAHRARELRLQGLFVAGRHAELLARSEDFLETYGEYPREDQLWFWRAQSYLAIGEPVAAARELDRVVWRYPYRPLAQASWHALRALESAGVRVPRHSLEERFERTDELLLNKHWDIVETELASLLREVLETRGEGVLANEIRWRRYRNAYGSGDFAAGLSHLEAIRAVGLHGIVRYAFYSQLSETYARLGRFEEGVEALREREGNRTSARRHSVLAEYYFNHGFFEESLAHTRQYLSTRSQRGWDFALLLFLAGEYEEAAAQLDELADRSSGTTRRRNRYFAGRARQELGDFDRARRAFEAVLSSQAGEFIDYYGLQATNRLLEIERSEPDRLLVGAAEPAVVTVANEAVGPEGDEGLRAARAPEVGLDELAGTALQSLEMHLTDFVRRQVEPPMPAASESGLRLFQRPARLHWDGPDGIADTRLSLVASGHEIRTAYWNPADEDAFARLTTEYGDLFPELERADFLLDVGERHAARVEARESSVEFRGLDRAFGSRRPTRARPIRLTNRRFAPYIDNRASGTGFWGLRLSAFRYPVPDDAREREAVGDRQIAIYDNRGELRQAFRDGLMTLGDYHFVRRFAQARGTYRRSEPDGEYRQEWSEVFPRAYPELVTGWSEAYELNPYVIWALMRVESSFNPDSISRSNARGLLQVIPKTGELISQRLGYWDFGPHNLMRPELSIEYGCYYFAELMTKFHGQELIAFAAYNAGPHQASRWVEGRGRAPLDAFIETIPFEQAREYAKKVYYHLALYRRLYVGEDHLYLGNVIDPAYELNVHF